MSPIPGLAHGLHTWLRREEPANPALRPTDPNGLVLEAWAQGFMVGALIIMSCITLANMRRGVLLHKLILLEVRVDWERVSSLHGMSFTATDRNFMTACFGLLARLLYPLQSANLCLVAIHSRHTLKHILVAT